MNKPKRNEPERRFFKSEIRVERAEDGTPERITGYAAVFNRDSVNLGGFTEEVAPGAFTEALKEDDVRALVDHNSSMILGRTGANTLRLTEDKTGLRMEIDLPNTQAARDIAESIDRGDVDGASFGFRTVEDDWNTKEELSHRTLKKVRLFDVGPVTFPAYPDTSVAVRSMEEWRGEQTEAEKETEKEESEDRARRQRHSEALAI